MSTSPWTCWSSRGKTRYFWMKTNSKPWKLVPQNARIPWMPFAVSICASEKPGRSTLRKAGSKIIKIDLILRCRGDFEQHADGIPRQRADRADQSQLEAAFHRAPDHHFRFIDP